MKAINILLVIVFAATLVACEPDPYAPIGLNLCQKDASTFPDPTVPYTPTECLEGVATFGEVAYIPIGVQFNYWLNALVPDPAEDYRLIYYPDGWPGNGLVCLSDAITPVDGRIEHYQKCTETDGSLPKEGVDDNFPDGAKIWLVLDADVDCTGKSMVAWNPDDYLFETRLIGYTDTGSMP